MSPAWKKATSSSGVYPSQPSRGVEVHRAPQVGDAERDEADALIHARAWWRAAAARVLNEPDIARERDRRDAGEPVELLVDGKPIARGEVVLIDEEFGLRITDVVTVPAQSARAEAASE